MIDLNSKKDVVQFGSKLIDFSTLWNYNNDYYVDNWYENELKKYIDPNSKTQKKRSFKVYEKMSKLFNPTQAMPNGNIHSVSAENIAKKIYQLVLRNNFNLFQTKEYVTKIRNMEDPNTDKDIEFQIHAIREVIKNETKVPNVVVYLDKDTTSIVDFYVDSIADPKKDYEFNPVMLKDRSGDQSTNLDIFLNPANVLITCGININMICDLALTSFETGKYEVKNDVWTGRQKDSIDIIRENVFISFVSASIKGNYLSTLIAQGELILNILKDSESMGLTALNALNKNRYNDEVIKKYKDIIKDFYKEKLILYEIVHGDKEVYSDIEEGEDKERKENEREFVEENQIINPYNTHGNPRQYIHFLELNSTNFTQAFAEMYDVMIKPTANTRDLLNASKLDVGKTSYNVKRILYLLRMIPIMYVYVFYKSNSEKVLDLRTAMIDIRDYINSSKMTLNSFASLNTSDLNKYITVVLDFLDSIGSRLERPMNSTNIITRTIWNSIRDLSKPIKIDVNINTEDKGVPEDISGR